MIAFLDEGVPVRLARVLADAGSRALRFPNEWKELENGALLSRLREAGVRCLITCDKNMQYQQSIAKAGIAWIVLPRQRFEDLAPLVPAISRAMEQAVPGAVLSIGLDGTVTTQPPA